MQCAEGEAPCTSGQGCCNAGNYCGTGTDVGQCVCFPASATVTAADGRTVAMPDLRSGDRVLSVGWDGRPVYREVSQCMHARRTSAAQHGHA
jgi:hypothetical protein